MKILLRVIKYIDNSEIVKMIWENLLNFERFLRESPFFSEAKYVISCSFHTQREKKTG